jgi:hypothetical protein
MKKTLLLLSVFAFSLHFGQFSKIEEVEKTYRSQNKEISKKYKSVYSLERIREEDENNTQRLDGYEAAIKYLQKGELAFAPESLFVEETKLPEYETGINGFRSLIAENFDISLITSTNETLKTTATFLINEKGLISNIKAEGDSREFNLFTIITLYKLQNKGKWKPAEKDGIPIKHLFTLPLTMKFE